MDGILIDLADYTKNRLIPLLLILGILAAIVVAVSKWTARKRP